MIAILSGLLKGWTDGVLMQITDGLSCSSDDRCDGDLHVGTQHAERDLVIGLLRWMSYACTCAAKCSNLGMSYMRLAVVAGATRRRLIGRHVPEPDQYTADYCHLEPERQ
jgi:hypothetical protein